MTKQTLNRFIRMALLTGSLLLFFQPGKATRERSYFEKLNITNGLSQNTVNTILQDRTGFMWFGTKDGLNRYDGHTFRVYKKDYHNLTHSLGNNLITALQEDKQGNIWVGTDAGLYIYDPEKDRFEAFPFVWPDGTMINKTVTHLAKDREGRMWVAVETQGLLCYNVDTRTCETFTTPQMRSGIRTLMVEDPDMLWATFYPGGLYYSTDGFKTLIPFVDSSGEEIFRNEIISRIHPGKQKCLYLGSEKEGLKKVNLSTREVKKLPLTSNSRELVFVRDILSYSKDELWIGTESGVFIYNTVTGVSERLYSSMFDPYSLSDNAVYCLYKDREEGVWVGTYFGGINYIPKSTTYFDKFYPTGKDTDLQGRRVREICKAYDDGLWIGTEDSGLYHFTPRTRQFRFCEASRDFTNVHALCIIDDKLWVGTFSQGIKVIDNNMQVVKTYLRDETPHCLADNSVFTIYQTSKKEIYLGTLFGLQRYRPETDDFFRIPELDGVFVYDIQEDSRGNLWLATYIYGVYMYDSAKGIWKHFLYDPADPESLPSNKVLSIFEDRNQTIWVTTQGGGVSRYQPSTGTFESYNSSNGFPDDVVYQIVEDENGFFWMTTNNGLVRFDRQEGSYDVFTRADGLLSNQFNYKSSYVCPVSGRIYFGSIDGLISFDVNNFTENTFIPPIVITDFLLFNQEVPVGEKGSPLEKNIPYLEKLTLSSKQNSFSFRMAALSYQAPSMNQIMYKLEGFDRDWNRMNVTPLVTYSNLLHGKYVLRIKGSNSHGVWNGEETRLLIHILPPFYLTYWAYAVYFILLAGLIYGLVAYFRNRSRQKEERLIELFNQEKERELHNAKIEFFTNVAHEIRTPLTLIKGPLDNILTQKNLTGEMLVDLNIMSKNTSRLLDLTNQLLDFRKTEIKGFPINYMEYNIPEILTETYLRFMPLIKQKQQEFTLLLPEEPFCAHVDKEAFTKIISNLFNNAVKYAAGQITVSLRLPEEENGFLKLL